MTKWNIWACECGRVYTTQTTCPYCEGEFKDRETKQPKKRAVTVESPLEAKFVVAWRALASQYPEPEREYQFHPERGWAFDFAFIQQKVAVEMEGGTWSGGRHVRGEGYANDCEKYNAAVELGWRLLRYTTVSSDCIEQIKRVLDQIK